MNNLLNNEEYQFLLQKELSENIWLKYDFVLKKMKRDLRKEKENFIKNKCLDLNDEDDVEDFKEQYSEILTRYNKINENFYTTLIQPNDEDQDCVGIKNEFHIYIQHEKKKYNLFGQISKIDYTKNRKTISIHPSIKLNNSEITNIVYRLYETLEKDKKLIQKLLDKKYKFEDTPSNKIKLKASFSKEYEEIIRLIYMQLIEMDFIHVKNFYSEGTTSLLKMTQASDEELYNFYNMDGNKKIDLTNIINSYIQYSISK